MNITVLGGMNLDITGVCAGEARMGDSNPGAIRLSPGGVGRNIASALARHGAAVRFVTCLCSDLPAQTLLSACRNEGIDLSLSYKAKGATSCYMAVHEGGGDLTVAVNDMAVMDELPAEHIFTIAEEINRSDACVIDANLNERVLAAVSEAVTVPLIADPVSMHKCGKLLPLMGKLTAIKPNLDEAMELTGEQTAEKAAQKLLRMGVKNCFISMGAKGLYYASEGASGRIAPDVVFGVSTNGAGDCLTAGIVKGIAQGLSAADCAAIGMAYSRELLASR